MELSSCATDAMACKACYLLIGALYGKHQSTPALEREQIEKAKYRALGHFKSPAEQTAGEAIQIRVLSQTQKENVLRRQSDRLKSCYFT